MNANVTFGEVDPASGSTDVAVMYPIYCIVYRLAFMPSHSATIAHLLAYIIAVPGDLLMACTS